VNTAVYLVTVVVSAGIGLWAGVLIERAWRRHVDSIVEGVAEEFRKAGLGDLLRKTLREKK
jgi:hypothetical protein